MNSVMMIPPCLMCGDGVSFTSVVRVAPASLRGTTQIGRQDVRISRGRTRFPVARLRARRTALCGVAFGNLGTSSPTVHKARHAGVSLGGRGPLALACRMGQPRMSAAVASVRSSSRGDLDRAIGELAGRARGFARLDARSRAAMLRECISGVVEVASAWSTHGLKVKGLSSDSAEELLAGPLLAVRHLRLLAESLDSIADSGRPDFGHSGAATG